MSTKGSRLGSLLNTPAPTADEDESFAAHQAAKDTDTAPTADTAPAPAARRPRPAGRLAERGTPVVLPRERRRRVPKEKLTVQLPSALIDALTALVDRDGTLRYDEVDAALRKHLRSKGIQIEED